MRFVRSAHTALFVSGSALMVNRHLAVTAKHVVEDYFSRIEGKPSVDGHHASFTVLAVQTLEMMPHLLSAPGLEEGIDSDKHAPHLG